jgi:hypothetical protein
MNLAATAAPRRSDCADNTARQSYTLEVSLQRVRIAGIRPARTNRNRGLP